MKINDSIKQIEKNIQGYGHVFADDLRESLSQHEFVLTYEQKKDGEVVTRRGTNNPAIIKKQTGNEVEVLSPASLLGTSAPVHYYDLTVGGWRCFVIENLHDIKQVQAVDEEDEEDFV